jgi:peptidoglycan/LPS O-acetylase OafA/YrhL
MISKQFSAELNCFRWVAALLVVISHARNLLFVDYSDVADKNIFIKMFYFITGFGHEAVIIFFVISGLLVGGISAKKYSSGRFDAGDFVVHRFSRIYIVLIPALVVGYLLDHIGLAYFNNSLLYTHSNQLNFNRIFSQHMDWGTWVGNALMLQHVSVEVFGSNGALWSLSYEWWYYCIFFCVIGIASRSNGFLAKSLYGFCGLLMLVLLPIELTTWFSIWLVGTAIGFSPLRRVKINPLLAYAVFFAVLAWSRFDHTFTHIHGLHINFLRDFALAAACFLLFTALSQRQSQPPTVEAGKFHSALAEFSYTTYLVHLPFLVFTVAVLNHLFKVPFYQQPTLAGFVYFLLLLGWVYLYSYSFSRLTESRTDRLRSWLNMRYKSWQGSTPNGREAGHRETDVVRNIAARNEVRAEAASVDLDETPEVRYISGG